MSRLLPHVPPPARERRWRRGRCRHGWAAGSSDDGGERVAVGNCAGCGVGSDPFAATHAVVELTMGAAGDEESSGYLCRRRLLHAAGNLLSFVSEKRACSKQGALIPCLQFCSSNTFNTAVDVEFDIPDYFDVVKHPMDLGAVRKKLAADCYCSPWGFVSDVRLTFANAMRYITRQGTRA
ncbi:hypothetical protein BHE74_00049411 [Ensete ventricosum]|nr:hypothetical protein BHE74_00049411 [Ensete ventricosum]